MATASRIAIVVFALVVAACALDTNPPDLTPDPNPDGGFSLARTWYTNPDDDRYYYDFCQRRTKIAHLEVRTKSWTTFRR